MNLFPIMQPQTESKTEQSFPLYRETAWDFNLNKPIFENGAPKLIEGRDAVLVWAWKALHTNRFVHEIYSWNYGCELESLIGQPYTPELKQSEAVRYVAECLLVNPYISEVEDVAVEFAGGKLGITCKLTTVYGEVNISV